MFDLVLLTAEDCHLCGHGRGVLRSLDEDGLVAWREVREDDPEGAALALGAPPFRPLLFEQGRLIAYGRLSERRLRRFCGSALGSPRERSG